MARKRSRALLLSSSRRRLTPELRNSLRPVAGALGQEYCSHCPADPSRCCCSRSTFLRVLSSKRIAGQDRTSFSVRLRTEAKNARCRKPEGLQIRCSNPVWRGLRRCPSAVFCRKSCRPCKEHFGTGLIHGKRVLSGIWTSWTSCTGCAASANRAYSLLSLSSKAGDFAVAGAVRSRSALVPG